MVELTQIELKKRRFPSTRRHPDLSRMDEDWQRKSTALILFRAIMKTPGRRWTHYREGGFANGVADLVS